MSPATGGRTRTLRSPRSTRSGRATTTIHVDGLIDAGFVGTTEELFQAAKVVNEAEYQRVVFTEFADHLLGGIRGDGDHGFDGYNPNVDARISHEFAAAAYRFGHSLINQTMTVLDAQGNPTTVQLFDAFLNPTNDASAFPTQLPPGYTPMPGYEQLGINGILGGGVTQAAEEVDVNIVNAVRNDLVRISADVFAFDVAREWDVGIGSINQIRADLMASTNPYVREAVGFAGNLSPYTSWEDFQARNNLSDSLINQFKQAYPDLELAAADIAAFQEINPGIVLGGPNHNIVKGIDRVDLFVGGLAETHINGGVVGQTFWVILHEQLDRLQEGDRLYYLDRVENLDFYQTVEEQGFSSIIARNTGLTGLPEDIFGTSSLNNDQDDNDDDNANGGGDDDNDDDNASGGGDDDDDDDNAGGGDDDDDNGTGTPTPQPVAHLVLAGTADTNVLVGGAGDDTLSAMGGDDVVVGHAGADAISGGDGLDMLKGGDGRDVIVAGAGDDQVFGGADADIIWGEAGADRLFGEQGNDMITAGAGDDSVFGGAGNDLFVAEVNDGNDVYFGDDSDGGIGIDTLDMSAATVDTFVNLGSGAYAHGTASSTQTGNDTIWGIENVNTGSGNDTIIASNAVNIMNGGNGNDVFKFPTIAAADGDTILGFAPGDRIDLSAIDAKTGTAASDAFTLVTGNEFTAAGQLLVSYTAEGNTLIQGNVTDGSRRRLHDRGRGTSHPDRQRERHAVGCVRSGAAARLPRFKASVSPVELIKSWPIPKNSLPYSVAALLELTGGFRGIVMFLFLISGIINILALTGSLYMMQIYDRALTSGSIPTLVAAVDTGNRPLPFPGIVSTSSARRYWSASARGWTRRLRRWLTEWRSTCHASAFRPRRRWSADGTSIRYAAFWAARGHPRCSICPGCRSISSSSTVLHPLLGALTLGGAFVLTVLTVISEIMTKRLQRRHAQGRDRAQHDCRFQRSQCRRSQGHGLCRSRGCQPLQRSQQRASAATDKSQRHQRNVRCVLAGAAHGAAVGSARSRRLSDDQGRTVGRRNHRLLGRLGARSRSGRPGDRQLEIVRRGSNGLSPAARHRCWRWPLPTSRCSCRRRTRASASTRSRSRSRVPDRSSSATSASS